jgi:magnesium transporter
MQRADSKLIHKTTEIYLRDLHDHVISVMDAVESFRDILSGLHDIYLSSINLKMNEIMKVLTIISTIFIPLTFIAGVYGMNFKYMPELEWETGYFEVLAFMLVLALVMVLYFKRKKWL